jgi:beta-lactamase regulating signal transducer with metallopeptidase domain
MMSSFLSGHWLPLVINTVLQSLFMLASVAVALVCTRKASAARRHLISVAALGALLLAPLISLLIPAPKPLLQVSGTGLTLHRSPVRTLAPLVPSARTGVAAASPENISPSRPATEQIPVTSPVPPRVMDSAHATPVGAPVAAAPVSLFRFLPWLAAIWLIGVLLVLGRLLVGFDRIRRIVRQSDSLLSESLQIQIRAILSEVGITRSITIVQASSRNPVSVAMTWGVWEANLLLPAEAAQWPDERLRVVLLHELAHIHRHDWLTQMLGQIVCAFYWFHPFVWLLNRQTQIEAERACDDAVLLAGVRAKVYAGHLLEVVKTMQAGREAPSAAVAMARPTQVRYRLQSILNAQRNRQSPSRSVRALVLLGTGLLLCVLSLLRPLAWANGHQQTTDFKRLPAIGPVVLLPNGASVELVAVGTDPTGYGFGDDWWTPDGKPVLELPKDQALPFASREYSYPDTLLRRALFFRVQVDPHLKQGVEFSTTGYVVDPTRHLQTASYRYGRNVRSDGYLLPPRPSVGTVLLGLPPTQTRCTYRFGIATGPWETIATTHLAPQPEPDAISIPADAILNQTRIVPDDMPHLSYQDPRGEHSLSLLGSHAPLGDVARRIVALDKDGKELSLGVLSYDDRRQIQQVPAWAQTRIAALRLQVRPYQWAEFKDILLVHTPAKKPLAIAAPPALPAFRHTFACGITLNVSAVTESRKEGGLWWKPDGTPLSGPVKGYEWLLGNFDAGWEHRVRPRALVLQLTSSRTMLSYTSAVRFVPSVPDETDAMLPGTESIIDRGHLFPSGTLHDFPKDLRQATLRYGIAAGPWKAVATIPMPTDARHAGPTGDPDQGGVIVEVPGYPKTGDVPRLEYDTLAGEHRDLPFKILDPVYLQDVARRFVAVDRAGHVFPLQSNNAAQETLDSAGHPIPLDPANAGRTDLPVGDYFRIEEDIVDLGYGDTGYRHDSTRFDLNQIREIRLEIRPYEWAEFPNIALQPKKTGSAH